MVPNDDNQDDLEDPSAEVTDIDEELEKAGKHGDGDNGPSILGEDSIADDNQV